ncbi:MAG: GNAT family N-acetyltransferase [Anaerolineae bacterium]
MSIGSLAEQIEAASLDAWPALEQIAYDGWILRFSDGYTKRANSVNSMYEAKLQSGTVETETKVQFAEQCYRDRGRPAIFRITPFSVPRDLDAFLEQRGYVQLDPTRVMVLDLADICPLGYDPTFGAGVAGVVDEGPGIDTSSYATNLVGELRQEDLDAWLMLFARLHSESIESQQIHRAILCSITAEVQPYLLDVRGVPVACALGVLDGERLGLFDLYVDPAFRRQGHGTDMTGRILAQAKRRGVRWVYLQVTEANQVAQGMYRKLGFGDLYRYWYRIQGGYLGAGTQPGWSLAFQGYEVARDL